MIKEDIDGVTVRSIVTRICDHCGVKDKLALGQILYSKNRKKTGKDYCKKCCYKYRINNQKTGKTYEYIYVAYKKHKIYYRYIMEKFLGRKLKRNEHIHHIDGETLNNDIDNLVVESMAGHKKIHNSLQNCVATLYQMGIVKFKEGVYHV